MGEAHRKDRWANRESFIAEMEVDNGIEHFNSMFLMHIKDTIEDELADALIRCLDLHYYLFGEVKIIDPEAEQLDYDLIADLDLKDNAEDLHTLMLALPSVALAGVEYLLQPLFILCEQMGMDDSNILFHIEEKMKYNKTRSKKHGKKY